MQEPHNKEVETIIEYRDIRACYDQTTGKYIIVVDIGGLHELQKALDQLNRNRIAARKKLQNKKGGRRVYTHYRILDPVPITSSTIVESSGYKHCNIVESFPTRNVTMQDNIQVPIIYG